MKRFLRWFYQRRLIWSCRKYDETVCCCGDTMSPNGYCWNAGVSCRSQKEYSITCAMENYDKARK